MRGSATVTKTGGVAFSAASSGSIWLDELRYAAAGITDGIVSYTISANSGAGGSVSPVGATSVVSGDSQAYTIAANPGYQIADVTVDGAAVGAVSSYTFNNITADHTISASFAPVTYTLTASAGANGSISPAGITPVGFGGSQSYTITANAGYQIQGVTVDGVSVGAVSSYVFSNISANHTIAATFALLPDTAAPSAPTAAVGSDLAPDQGGVIGVSWTASTDNIGVTGYKLYRGVAAGVYDSVTTLGAVSSTSVSGLTNATRYYFAVSALDAAGNESEKSPEFSAVPTDDIAPAVPTGLGAAVLGTDRIRISWTANAESDLAGYDVYRDGVKVNGAPVASASYTDSGLTTATVYAYSVAARDVNGNASGQTGTVSATTASEPPAPGTSGTLDAGFESGTDGALLASPPWTAVGSPLHREYDNARAKVGTKSAWIQGPASTSFAGTFEAESANMTEDGAEIRFWLYQDTTNQNRRFYDNITAGGTYGAYLVLLAADGTIQVNVAKTAPTAGYITGYNVVGTQTTGWTEYRIVHNFGSQTITLSTRKNAADAWTGLKSAGASGFDIPMRGSATVTKTGGVAFSAASSGSIWLDELRYAAAGITDPVTDVYTITATSGAGGSISPSGAQSVVSGAVASYNVVPAPGYAISSVTVDGLSFGAVSSYTFNNVTADHTISATFAPITYQITPSAGFGGSISPATPQLRGYGGSSTFSITPSSGYQIADVKVDGVSAGAVSTYTFSAISANHTIAATFSLIPASSYQITSSAGANGSISPAGATNVASGGSQAYTITPSSGYVVADVLVDGVSVGSVSAYTFSNVTAVHTITATFTPISTGGDMAVTQFNCDSCHVRGSALDNHDHPCDACHEVSWGHAGTPADIHANAVASTCVPCHDSELTVEHNGRTTTTGAAFTCATCHETTDPVVRAAINAGNSECSACHSNTDHAAAHGSSVASTPLGTTGTVCGDCHVADIQVEHSLPSASSSALACANCHPTPRDTLTPAWAAGCVQGGCHPAGTPAEMHGNSATAHAPAAGNAACFATGCHVGTDISAIHASAATTVAGTPRTSCMVCHSGGVPASKDCTTCHTNDGVDFHAAQNAVHVSATNATCFGAGCHEASQSLPDVHSRYVGAGSANPQYATTCELCHKNENPNRIDWAVQQPNARCTDSCHVSNHEGMSGGHATTSASAACTSAGCHSTDINTIHGTYSDLTRCGICHTSTANWSKTGDCVSCHDTANPHPNMEATHTAAPPASPITISGVDFPAQTCTDCHPNMVISSSHTGDCSKCHPNPRASVAPAWDKSCVQGGCHTSESSLPMHSNVDTAHAPIAGQTCYTTGCHAATGVNSLAETHSNATTTVAGSTRTSCQVCHADGTPASGACSSCHADKVDGTHGATAAHGFTTGADANAAGDAGCSNSGSGCHGTDATYASFADYHPATGCVSGACHTSSSKAGYAGNGDCQSCHDGSYTNAPARAALSTEHYVETTHTASGLTATVSAGGTASAACTDCHDGASGLAGQHTGITPAAGSTYGTTISCVECHNDTRVNGNATMLAGWTAGTCAACHTAGSAAPQHATTAPVVNTTSAASCGASGTGCHTTYDVHALHKDAASCALAGCHDAAQQGKKPAITACGEAGGCHATEGTDFHAGVGAAHNASGADVGVASTGGLPCATCHFTSASATTSNTVVEHAKASSKTTGGSAITCTDCHSASYFPNGWNAAAPASNTCVACHATGQAPAPHTGVATAHDYDTVAGNYAACSGPGTYCHNSNVGDIADVGDLHAASRPGDASCTSCHNNDAPPTKGLCADCHGTRETVHAHTSSHNTVGSEACTSCHPDQIGLGGHVIAGVPSGCHTCHDNDTLTANGTRYLKGTYTAQCTSCHNDTVIGAKDYTTAHYSETTHTAAPFTSAAQGTGADGTVEAEGKECSTCHTATLKVAHETVSVSGGSVTCVECHTDTTLGSAAVIASNWANDRCTDCHDTGAATTHDAYAADHTVSTTRGCAGSGAGCHGYTNLAKLHDKSQAGGAATANSCANIGCHTTKDARPSAIDADSCGSGSVGGCHADKTTANHGYSAAKHTATPAAESYTINGATYSSPACDSCHEAVLDVEHAKASSSSAAAGCVACHPTPKDSLTPAWDKGCAQGDCHTITSAAPKHAAIDIAHMNVDTYGCADPGCHTGDLAAVHSVASTTTAGGQTRTSCMVCHADGVPASNDCATCHAPTFEDLNVLMDGHFAGTTHVAAPATQTVTISGVDFANVGCADCHSTQFELQATHGGYSSCTKCHPSPKNTLTPAWDKGCAQGGCHTVTSTMPMHASIDASHAPVAGQTCYTAGCHAAAGTASIAATHKNASAVLGGSTRTSCQVCHWNGTPASGACASCHADKVDGTHGATAAHGFTTGSDANAAGDAGCSNSGSGCHGTDATYASFADYHPATGCVSGACHTSSSKAGYAGNGDCQSCHDGSYTNAPARSALSTEHYVETTHTASGLTATVSAGGTASAACTTCHDGATGLAGQHTGITPAAGSTYGTTISCVECHNDTRVNGNATMLTGWTEGTCAACHATGTAAPQHATTAPVANATSTQSCGASGLNCHTTYDVHALHKDAASCALAGCHDTAQQGKKPTTTTCGSGGACHSTYTAGASHSPAANHAPTNSVQANATFSGVACSACHVVTGGLTAEHALTTSVKSTSSNTCLNCHNSAASTAAVANNWSAKDTTGACAACHTNGLAIHATVDATKHAAATSTGCASTGVGCHNTGNLAAVGTDKSSTIHDNCMRCHDRTATAPNMAFDPAKNSCGSCHASGTYNSASSVHNGTGGLADGTDSTHHTATLAAGSYAAVYAGGQTCTTCHSGALKTAHTASSAGSVDCAGCHNDTTLGSATVVKANWTAKTCTSCHTTSGVHTAYETGTGIAASHKATSTAGCASSGAGCHSNADMGALHANTAAGCVTCHAADKNMAAVSKTCGQSTGCHTTGTFHAGVTGSDALHTAATMGTQVDPVSGFSGNTCQDCHTGTLLTAHAKTGPTSNLGWTNECTDCHNSLTPINSAAVVAGNWTPSECATCHTSSHDVYASGHQGQPSGTNTCLGCHTNDSTDLRIVHKNAVTVGSALDTGCGIVGCHNVADATPSIKSCGTGGTCHTDKIDGNHGSATAHTFTSASDHVAAANTGCTNSGAGCHGSESTYGSFVDYHPNTGCMSGACHTSASKATYTGDHECVSCHNGNYTNAPDVVSLDAVTPNGHYSETTHTATGMTTSLNAGGTQSATCNDCHNATSATTVDDLYAQHQGIGAVNQPATETTSFADGFESGSYSAWDADASRYVAAVPGANTPVWNADMQTTTWTSLTAPTTPALTRAFNTNSNTTVATLRTGQTTGHDSASTAYARLRAVASATGSAVLTRGASGSYMNLSGYSSATVSWYDVATSMHAGDSLKLEWFDGTTWTQEWILTGTAEGTLTNNNWAAHSITIPANKLSASNALRFTFTYDSNATQTTTYLDDILVSGNAVGTPEAGWNVQSTTKRTGTYGARAIGADATTRYVTKTGVSNAGADSVTLKYAINYASLEAADSLAVQTYNGTAWSAAKTYTLTGGNLAWTDEVITGLPASTSGVRFAFRGDTADDLVYVDNVSLTKVVNGASTAGTSVSCSGCHNANAKTISLVSAATAWNDQCDACHNATDMPTKAASHLTSVPAVAGSSTQGCASSGAGCHDTTDLHSIHKGNGGADPVCSDCHDYGSQAVLPVDKTCGVGGACHNGATYTATDHGKTGNDAAHTATGMTTTLDGTTYNTGGGNTCADCHSSGLRSAHTTVTATLDSGRAAWTAPFCANCHNSTYAEANSVTTIKTNSWSAQTCDQCHVTNGNGKHTTYTGAEHTASTGSNTCTGAGCHATLDVRTLHNKVNVGCTLAGADSFGVNGACHDLDKSMPAAALTCGTGTTGCHTSHAAGNHGPDHNAAQVLGAAVGTTGQTYGYGKNVGCFMTGANTGCHFQDLRREHGSTAYLTAQGVAGTERTMNGARGGSADGCTVCHATGMGTAGAYAARTAIQTAITNGDYRCVSCHFETTDAAGTTGVQAPHKSTEKIANAPLGTTAEWAAAAQAQGGGHNSFGVSFPKSGAQAYGATVNGVAMTGTFAAMTGFVSGWTTTSVVTCTSTGCHNRTTAPNGPQGATVPWYYNNGTAVTGTISTHWYNTVLNGTTTPAATGCNNCHQTLSSTVHSRGDHYEQCQNCHIRIPHAWKRPRLLRRVAAAGGTTTQTVDALPYTDPALTNSLQAYKVTATQTNFSSQNSCNDNCGQHTATTPYWP
ncbi:MAG: hypothetical protein HGB10_09620 [Coriobacteriia bacterium]|nr:hypothetical protein [Coriobacteriia bacterium]